MLSLVLAHRHMCRLVEKYVGGHEHRIAVECETRVLVRFAFLFFELDHLVQPTERRHRREDPLHLGVLRYL